MKVLAESGAELSQEELLDALWLAGKLPQGAGPLARAADVAAARAERQHSTLDQDEPTESEHGSAEPMAPATEPVVAEPMDPRSTRPLLAAAQPRANEDTKASAAAAPSQAVAVRAPDSRLPGAGQFQLGKALKPLRQRFPDPRRNELDVPRTVAAMADTGVPEIVTRPLRTRWLSLALVVDDGISMVLWQRLAADVRALMERAGAYRDVRVYGLDTCGGAPSLRTSPYRRRGSLLSPEVLCDPTGNTLVLVVSDGVGEAWRDGGMRRVMDRWGRCGPTAIVHALPSRLWASTGIRARLWQVTTRRRGGPTHAWYITDPDLPPELVTFDAARVPVLAPTPRAVAEWARLVASPGGTAILPLWDGGRSGTGRPIADIQGSDAAEAVLRFREAASAEAYRLAAHMAAVAPVTPPVMRLVQAALGPPTDPGHLTEVFLGGLMHELDADVPDRLPHHRRFDFAHDARRVLLSAVSPKELLRTTEAVTRCIEDSVGRAPVFPAWVGHPDGAAVVDNTGRAFGWLREQLLVRFGIPSIDPEPVVTGTTDSTRQAEEANGESVTSGGYDEPNGYASGEALPDGWGKLLPEDPVRLGRFRLRARSERGWPHLTMYLAEDEDGTVVTVRAPILLHARDPEAARDLVRTEAECLTRMQGSYAPTLVGASVPDSGDLPWAAASCIQRSDDPSSPPAPNLKAVFDEARGVIPEELFLRIGVGLTAAVALAHDRGLVHGSLAPQRVLVTDRDIRLVGWATATIDGVDSPHRDVLPLSETYLEAVDTGLWLVPESDVYAVGALLLAFHSGQWDDPRTADARSGSSPAASRLDPTLRRLLWRCLEDDAARRPSAADLAEAFAIASGAQAFIRTEEFLIGITEDVRLMRELAREDVGTYGSEFARLLRTFSNHLASVRQRDESLAAARESVEVYRQLTVVDGDPVSDELSTDLAAALSNLSVRLGEVGRAAESVDTVSEAESLYRELRARDFGAHGAGHAMTLNNLSNRLAETGRHREAVGVIEEAVSIGRRRMELGAPGAGCDLARSLTNLGSRLGDLGRRPEARAAVAEAVQIHGALPAEDARRVWTDHAVSLNNFAVLLGGEGRHDDALSLVDASFALLDQYGREQSRAASEIHEQSRRVRSWLEALAGQVSGQ
ncbi:tetratricopeptide repeat-containing protein kinase family protein [Streptomyces sp. NPDC051079]|uniref:tetratricopeptide repeat-containing protein kinase family protein n=1 Tax=Streptomyces sp. NPDC051079 TaxID=3155043 RepID=UPI00344D0357